jgi:hypothetical protein
MMFKAAGAIFQPSGGYHHYLNERTTDSHLVIMVMLSTYYMACSSGLRILLRSTPAATSDFGLYGLNLHPISPFVSW